MANGVSAGANFLKGERGERRNKEDNKGFVKDDKLHKRRRDGWVWKINNQHASGTTGEKQALIYERQRGGSSSDKSQMYSSNDSGGAKIFFPPLPGSLPCSALSWYCTAGGEPESGSKVAARGNPELEKGTPAWAEGPFTFCDGDGMDGGISGRVWSPAVAVSHPSDAPRPLPSPFSLLASSPPFFLFPSAHLDSCVQPPPP